MKIADLYVEVGTKGGPATSQQLTTVRASIQDVKSMSLAAKAAIAGLIYELGNLSRQSMAMGQSLQQFGNLTGLNPEALQRWQYALQQSGVAAEETASTIKHLQDVTNDIIQNGNIPAGFKVIAESVHLDPTRLRDTFYVLDKFREYARQHKDNPDMTRALLAPTIGNDKVIQALMTGTANPANTPRSQMYSSAQRKALAADSVALQNLTTKLEHELGGLTAKFGGSFIKDIDKVATAVFHLVDAFAQLAEQLKLVQGIGVVVSGWAEIFNTATQLTKDVSGQNGKKEGLLPSVSSLKYLAQDLLGTPPPGTRVGGHSVTNHTNVTVHGAVPVSEEAIKRHVDKAVGGQNSRAHRALNTGQVN